MKIILNNIQKLKNYHFQIMNSDNLSIINVSKLKLLIITFSIIIFFSSFSIFGYKSNEPKIIKIKNKSHITYEIIEKYEDDFSKEKFIKLLKRLKMKHIDIVMKQAILESCNFKSKIFLENNNLFGMRLPSNRITTAIGENLNFAVYEKWEDSVIDYGIYQSTYLRKFNRQQYIEFLKNNYAENKNYVNTINKLK